VHSPTILDDPGGWLKAREAESKFSAADNLELVSGISGSEIFAAYLETTMAGTRWASRLLSSLITGLRHSRRKAF
jgi:hypothetical protein